MVKHHLRWVVTGRSRLAGSTRFVALLPPRRQVYRSLSFQQISVLR